MILAASLWLTACTTTPSTPAPTSGIPGTVPVIPEPTLTLEPTVRKVTPAPTAPPPPTLVVQTTETRADFLQEMDVQELPLGAPLNEAEAEISGMAWHQEMLVLLPQFPQRYGGQVFGIPKEEVIRLLESRGDTVLNPVALAFDDGGLHDTIVGFEGFEAIAFFNQQVFVTIEVRRTPTTMTGYLVTGEVDSSNAIRLNAATLTEIPAPMPLENYSDEAITISNDTIYTFYEANGEIVNPDAAAHRFTLTALDPLEPLTLIPLEYRLTDATPVDSENRFWVINYLFPGDIPKLRLSDDLFRSEFGEGPSHARSPGVERLIQLEITENSIVATGAPPVYLTLQPGTSRNWGRHFGTGRSWIPAGYG